MKLSNFRLTRVIGSNPIDLEYYADVDVTTIQGILWWKKIIVTRCNIRRKYVECWHFTDTGEFTPGMQAANLERVWDAKYGMKTEINE